jgi:hypothetical protein
MRRRPHSVASAEGSAARALLWLMVGLAILVALVVLSAPELVWTEPGATSQLLLVASLAGLPGLALLLWLAFRRRGSDDDAMADHPEGHPDQRRED